MGGIDGKGVGEGSRERGREGRKEGGGAVKPLTFLAPASASREMTCLPALREWTLL